MRDSAFLCRMGRKDEGNKGNEENDSFLKPKKESKKAALRRES